MRRFVMVAALAAILAGCTHSPEDVRTTVQAMGMKDVIPKGYAIFGCPKDDRYHTAFEATAADGTRVKGVVCGDIFQGNTVRITGKV